MSAYIVSRAHIDALIEVAIRGPRDKQSRWYAPRNVALAEADHVGRMLWLENHKSVAYRYPTTIGEDLPSPIGLTLADIEGYTFSPHGYLNWMNGAHQLSIAGALKAIHCLEYQSCEHPGWGESEAYRFLQDLKHSLIGVLPGYDEADWEIRAYI